jgi:hypothetical protein
MFKSSGSHTVSAKPLEATQYVGKKDLSFLHILQTGSGANIQWPMGDGFSWE